MMPYLPSLFLYSITFANKGWPSISPKALIIYLPLPLLIITMVMVIMVRMVMKGWV